MYIICICIYIYIMYQFKHILNWYMISLFFLGLFGTLVSLGMLGVSLGDVLLQVFRRPVALRHRGLSLDLPVAVCPVCPVCPSLKNMRCAHCSWFRRSRFWKFEPESMKTLARKEPHSWVWRQSRDGFLDAKKTAKMQCSAVGTKIIQDSMTTS